MGGDERRPHRIPTSDVRGDLSIINPLRQHHDGDVCARTETLEDLATAIRLRPQMSTTFSTISKKSRAPTTCPLARLRIKY